MEGTGRDGGREQTGASSSYTISSSSGTIVSAAYTSGASRLSSWPMEGAMLLDLELNSDEDEFSGEESKEKDDTHALQPINKPSRRETNKREKEEKMKQMVQEFFATPSAATTNYSMGVLERWFTELEFLVTPFATNYNMSVLERWFTDLGVPWILHVNDASSAGLLGLMGKAPSWIRALSAITKSVLLMAPLFPNRSSVGLPNICEEGHTTEGGDKANVPDQFQFAQFIQNTTFKMLAFVDVIVASNAKTTINGVRMHCVLIHQYEKVTTLLGVRGALSRALVNMSQSFHSRPSTEVERIKSEIVSLLSAKEGKTNEAIWRTMEQIRTKLIYVCNDASSSLTPQGSAGNHEATWFVMRYIEFMLSQYSSLNAIASEAARLGKYMPQIRDVPHLDSMIVETVSCVEQKLANKSKSFPDQSLRFLFLLNHSNAIRHHLCKTHPSLEVHDAAIIQKVEGYIESYIRVSWKPVLSCMINTTPSCFRINYSPNPMSKFESEFQKIYSAQKQWKVPDPELRERLRKAIIEKIIPGYIEYIEDNNVTTQKFSPHEMEEMLQDLFEGS